jgi:hypothetical protein
MSHDALWSTRGHGRQRGRRRPARFGPRHPVRTSAVRTPADFAFAAAGFAALVVWRAPPLVPSTAAAGVILGAYWTGVRPHRRAYGSGQTSSKTRNKSYNKLKTLSMTLLSKTISCQGRESVLFLFFTILKETAIFSVPSKPLCRRLQPGATRGAPGDGRARRAISVSWTADEPADAALAATLIAPGSPGSKERIFPTLIRVQLFEKSRFSVRNGRKRKDFFGASRAFRALSDTVRTRLWNSQFAREAAVGQPRPGAGKWRRNGLKRLDSRRELGMAPEPRTHKIWYGGYGAPTTKRRAARGQFWTVFQPNALESLVAVQNCTRPPLRRRHRSTNAFSIT